MPYVFTIETWPFSAFTEYAPGTRLAWRPRPSWNSTVHKNRAIFTLFTGFQFGNSTCVLPKAAQNLIWVAAVTGWIIFSCKISYSG